MNKNFSEETKDTNSEKRKSAASILATYKDVNIISVDSPSDVMINRQTLKKKISEPPKESELPDLKKKETRTGKRRISLKPQT